MTALLRYDPTAARKLIPEAQWEGLRPRLEAARREVLDDVVLLHSGLPVPAEKQPLDAGFIDLPQRLLMEREEKDGSGAPVSLLGRIEASAARLRSEIDRLVLLGIGGSYMGLRALFEALCRPYHNELTREERGGTPRLYYEGENLDNDAARGLLELFARHCRDPKQLPHRWGIVVISKSGGTLETAAGFRLFREALEQYYGPQSDDAKSLVVPITGEVGKLRSFADARRYPDVFPVPDGVGGRFSVFTAVGLYPAAVLGIDVGQLLRGAADMTERFREAPCGENPVLEYVATGHLLERERGMTIRVLSTWGKRLEAAGLWYDQLLAESLGKVKHHQEYGATPFTVVNTRDLHSRGQQHQEGRRDKLITNVIVEQCSSEPLKVPAVATNEDQDGLNKLAGKTMPELLRAAFQGTNEAYAEALRPTADIVLPRLDAYCLGQLLQMLMLATVVEGRLIGVNPYGQPGVEAYKRNMGRILGG
jgi:glucose-6-phosphate isomerase